MTHVEYVEYDDKKIPFRISYGSLSKWQDETGKSLDELDQVNDNLKMIEPLFFHAVVLGCRVMNIECPYDREGLQMVLDANWLEFIESMGSFFQTGRAVPAKKKK
jgi:hypothetical protein